MGLRDTAINYLNSIFGKEREELDRALSPSIEAEKNLPTNIYSLYGREDIGGLLSVSQNLMDVYADYEAMKDYPDISCFAEGTLVYICDGSMVKAVPIEWLVTNNEYPILALEKKTNRITKVAAFQPRLTGRNVPIIKIGLSNGLSLKVTPEHRVLVNDDYVKACDLKLGDILTGPPVSFPITGMGFLLDTRTTDIRVTTEAVDAGVANVYDVTTETHNLLANGVVCHNSAFRYFANDATQPNIDTGRVIWVTSKHEAIKRSADTLLRKRLRLEDDIWSMAYGLVHMGNEFNELLVTENGVVGLNYLPPVTMRRIERADGALIGFMQDITGRFTEDAKNLKAFMNGQGTLPDHIAVFEDWQVCHMRLNQAQRRSVYGQCQPADSIVWTRNGPAKLIDVKVGDVVLTRNAGQLTTTRVKHKFHNGIKQLYKIKTTHRETRATDNHPFLVDNGNRDYSWVQLINLKVGDLLVCCSTLSPGTQMSHVEHSDFISEAIESIEKDVCEDVYDIEVENDEHNFICDGFVVHNSIAHDSRAIWKRLLLLEDSMLLYRLCLRGDSKIWTPNGYKEIKDINEGDEVYSYGMDDKLKKTKVTYKKHNGKDKIFKVKSKHYEIHANATHPVLTEVISRTNSNKKYTRTLEYVEVRNLQPGYHKFLTPKKDEWDNDHAQQTSLLRNLSKVMEDGHYVVSSDSLDIINNLRTLTQQLGYKASAISSYADIYKFEYNTHQAMSETIESVTEVGVDDIYDIGVEAEEHNFIADGVVVHNTRSPQRMKYAIEVGDMPPDKVEGVLRRAKQELKKKPLVNPKTQKMDMRYNPMCVTGDTVVPLLSGESKTVIELIEDFNKGITNWVYSIDNTKNNAPVPGEIIWAGATRKNASLVKVILDNNKSIRCTPDHKFMLRDGTYKEAGRLTKGDSLMPLYTRLASKSYGSPLISERKVLLIESLDYKEDTYCITVSDTHCFATDAGVVIKNSSDEDIIFGMREGRPLATAEIMAGPVWPAIDDVEFFLRKLHATLNVPRSWLGQDGPPPAKSILSSEDIRACRVTMGVQRELRNGLERIIRVDQACRNIDPWKYDFEVNMTIPSGIFELAQMEIRNARADFASRYLGFTSMDYIRKNVFHLSDEVIAEIEKQSEKERDRQLETALKQNKAQADMQLELQKQQLAAQQQQVMANPEMANGEPNQAGEIPQLPDPLMPLPSDLPKSTLDWKIYDNSKRIEELREGETRRRIGELEDKISKLMDRDAEFGRRIKDHQGFMDDLKNTLPRNMNG